MRAFGVEESTITGSIGVVGGKLCWKKLWEEKIGINTTEFNRGKRAAIFSMNDKWTDEERATVRVQRDSLRRSPSVENGGTSPDGHALSYVISGKTNPELFMPFEQFPWFRSAPIGPIHHVEQPSPW